MDPAQRVRDLVRLAVDAAAAPNEARNAALSAARLIVLHRIVLGAGSEVPVLRAQLARETAARVAAEQQLAALEKQIAAPPPPSWVSMAAAKFGGRCVVCRATIQVGSPCQWKRGAGVRCEHHEEDDHARNV